jgi:hypothetical protein
MSSPNTDPIPALRHVLSIDFETIRTASAAHPEGNRYLMNATGGRFQGEGPNGPFHGVVRAAADWVTQRPDGSMSLDVRAQLQASDGTVILMTYDGISADRLVHTAARFSAPSNSAFAWINRLVCLSVGTARDGGVSYRLYTFA